MRHIVSQLSPVVECLELSRRLGRTPGALGALEGYVLHMLAGRGPGMGDIVVVGRQATRAACYLAEGSRQAGRELVTVAGRFLSPAVRPVGAPTRTVDGGQELSDLMNALVEQDLDDWIRLGGADGGEASSFWTRPIRLLLFIEAEAEEAREDFDRWARRVVRHGLAAYVTDPDPRSGGRQIEELIAADKRFEDRLAVGALRVTERV